MYIIITIHELREAGCYKQYCDMNDIGYMDGHELYGDEEVQLSIGEAKKLDLIGCTCQMHHFVPKHF